MLSINRYHIRLLVRNFRECFRFYADMLELPVRYGDEDADYTEFKTDGVHIALYRKNLMRQALGKTEFDADLNAGDRQVIVLRTDDVDRVYAILETKGVVFDTPPQDRPDWGCRTAHFRDPDGNLLELNSDLK